MKKRIAVIGAGPGGLSAAMILSHAGHEVTVFEKSNQLGGRNGRLTLENVYHFDIGPTFLLMKDILAEVFELAGTNIEKELNLIKVDPMYDLHFDHVTVSMTSDHKKMKEEIAKKFPGEEKSFEKYLKYEEKRLKKMYPCLKADYSSIKSVCKNIPNLLRVLPHLSLSKTLYEVLSTYFNSETLKLCFTFQAKYLGMSPWNCPGFFAMLAYAEHKYGIYHTQGGLSEISQAMANVATRYGAHIHLNTPVEKVIVKNGIAEGIKTAKGFHEYDDIIINADFGHAMTTLFEEDTVPKFTKKKLEKKGFSCSTVMMYLALDKLYDLSFHSIYFAKNYHDNLNRIHEFKPIDEEDFSFYVRNASILDKTLAPAGHSGLYILVPVSNLRSQEDWVSKKSHWQEIIIQALERRVGLKDIRNHIVATQMITPDDWESRGVYLGATFNLAHSLDQMLYFRPHNQLNGIQHCYLVGGGTHPGSGLPTIYESARIATDLINQ